MDLKNSNWFSFGDSFTYGACGVPMVRLEHTYIEYLRDLYNSDGSIVRSGWPGSSIVQIVCYYLKHAHKIKENDVVVFMRTTPERLLIPGFSSNHEGDIETYVGEVPRETLIPINWATVDGRWPSDVWENYDEIFGKNSKRVKQVITDYMLEVHADDAGFRHLHIFYENMIDLCMKDVESKGAHALTIDFMTWWSLKSKHYYCSCGHWNERGHKVVALNLYDCLEQGTQYLTQDNFIEKNDVLL